MNDITYYPNPLKRRERTVILNDGFLFSFDNRSWQKINVPYCPESKLSGIGYTDFIPECFYKKKFTVEKNRERAVLNFGAVDYMASVFINGKYVGVHTGGYTPFRYDITNFVNDGENELFLHVRDDKVNNSPRGKQSYKRNSFGCFYTRTTGIWQSVWLEYTSENHVRDFYFYPDISTPALKIGLLTSGRGKYDIEITFGGEIAGRAQGEISFRKTIFVPLSIKKLWKAGEGNLYDVKIRYENDEVYSYFGLREVRYEGMDFLLNGEKTYQRLVLDQGYNPEGGYTSPGVEYTEADVLRGMRLGFNGARLHQKVFEPAFLYFCDKHGYMVWGEFPSWGIDFSDNRRLGQFIAEWEETLRRDFNHPSIITWCPLNEIWGNWEEPDKKGDTRFCQAVYDFTKLYDKTRPCVDVSGGFHGEKTDVFDFHSYEPVDKIRGYLKALDERGELDVPLLYGGETAVKYKMGQPVNFSECGGIALGNGVKDSTDEINEGAVRCECHWGYGKTETRAQAFIKRYAELMRTIYESKKLSGFCYTQLYDVEQEVNGFYEYDRKDKFGEEEKNMLREITLGKRKENMI